MSNSLSVKEEAVLNLRIFRSINLVVYALLYYDYTLTVTREIQYYWRRKGLFTYGTILFFITRYLALLGYPLIIMHTFVDPPLTRLCPVLTTYLIYLESIIQCCVNLSCSHRVAALYSGRQRRIVIAILTISLLAVNSITVWALFSKKPSDSEPEDVLITYGALGCPVPISGDLALALAEPWATNLVFDIIIFSLTIYKALLFGWNNRATLWRVILQDGALVWSVLFAANLLNIVVLFTAAPAFRPVAGTIVNVLYVILVGRMMINLRVQYHKMEEDRVQAFELTELTIGTLEFSNHDETGRLESGHVADHGFDELDPSYGSPDRSRAMETGKWLEDEEGSYEDRDREVSAVTVEGCSDSRPGTSRCDAVLLATRSAGVGSLKERDTIRTN